MNRPPAPAPHPKFVAPKVNDTFEVLVYATQRPVRVRGRTLIEGKSADDLWRDGSASAVLDRLGYELTFVPKEAAAGLTAQASLAPTTPTVKTRVERARDQVKSPMAVIAPKSGKTE